MHVMSAAMPGKPGGRPKTRVRTMSRSYEISEPDSEEDVGYAMEAGEPDMDYAGLDVTSKGGASATFKVPGLVTIPSDYAVHNFTIVQLDLEAEMSWISVPKVDARVHLKVRLPSPSYCSGLTSCIRLVSRMRRTTPYFKGLQAFMSMEALFLAPVFHQ